MFCSVLVVVVMMVTTTLGCSGCNNGDETQ